MKIITLDIGGANIKIFDGNYKSFYFPFWKRKDEFKNFIKNLNLKADFFVITTTAELADCFKDKKEGINFIIDHIKRVIDGEIFFLSNDLNFKILNISEARKNLYNIASANFIATGKYISERENEGIIVDIGSTTTDIIPFKNKKILSKNNDLERLQNFQLIYTGVLRTNVATIVKNLKFREKKTKISSEYFSITADVYRILNEIDENDYVVETPDGMGKDIISCKRRLARIILCDLNEITDKEIYDIAKQIRKKQIYEIKKCIDYNKEKFKIKNVFILGKGKFLGKYLNASLKYENLSAVECLYHLINSRFSSKIT